MKVKFHITRCANTSELKNGVKTVRWMERALHNLVVEPTKAWIRLRIWSSRRPHLPDEAAGSAPAGCSSLYRQTLRWWSRNVGPEEHIGELLHPICWDAELILESTSFSLPCGVLATGWGTVESLLSVSIRHSNGLSAFCLHDSNESHLLHLTLSAQMSANGWRTWFFCFLGGLHYVIWLHTPEICRRVKQRDVVSSSPHFLWYFL